MDKKITAITILLMIVVSATIAFVFLKQTESTDNQTYSPTGDDVTYEEISNEIDDSFISEDDEVDIGDMI